MTQKQRPLRIEPDPHGIGRYGRKAAEMRPGGRNGRTSRSADPQTPAVADEGSSPVRIVPTGEEPVRLRIAAFSFHPELHPILFGCREFCHVGDVCGIRNVPLRRFEIILEVLGFEDVAALGERQILHDSLFLVGE